MGECSTAHQWGVSELEAESQMEPWGTLAQLSPVERIETVGILLGCEGHVSCHHSSAALSLGGWVSGGLGLRDHLPSWVDFPTMSMRW